MEAQMSGAELASMRKSNVQFKKNRGVICEALNLTDEQMRWWRDAKVGVFIHWGLFSILGHGEWAMFNERIPYEEYRKLALAFDPQDFSPSEWTGLAKAFGARYMVMVTRHHDGFALWDSAGSYDAYTSAATASGRDFVREYVDACRADGMRVGLYYSPMDWRFPGYFQPKELPESAQAMKRQCHAQVEELCRDYGTIDVLWYDGGWLAHSGSDADAAWLWDPIALNRMVRRYQPNAVLNPRSGLAGDFECDEGAHEIVGGILPIPWEKCMSVSGSWAWRPDDHVFGADDIVRMLANVVCRGGNLLLNVAPDRNGKIDPRAVATMRAAGAWIQGHAEAIYDTEAGPWEPVDGVCGSTHRGDAIYVYVLDREAFGDVRLPPIDANIVRCEAIGGGACGFAQDADGVRIDVPDGARGEAVTVVKIVCDREIG